MAQVVVSPILGVLFDNLNSLIREVGFIWGDDKEMKKLASTLSTIQAVLEDAEEKQVTNEAIVNWLGKLKEAAYDADDILDEWTTEAMQLELGSEHATRTRTKRVCDSFLSYLSFEHIKFRRKIAKKITELRETFNEIAAEKLNFHLTPGGVERKVELYPSRETSSIVTEPQIYGRAEDKAYIVGLLLDNVNNQDDLSVCPILGIGGVGKTTIAQSVYNDERVIEHFEVRIWICVSDDFDVKMLARKVLMSISGRAWATEDLNRMEHYIQEDIAGKRFLLVLDDVWNENQEEWNRFKYLFKGGAKGSSIIVTTRLRTVAAITGTCPSYLLKFLSDEDCWLLFRQRAFGLVNEESPKLVEIGKEIVKKCGGVPLAAKVLGGLMRSKVGEKEWLLVRNNGVWDLPQSDENTILPALRLSYSHLSLISRQCFAYCSIFPKDHEMKKDELIHLWMANGLFQYKQGIELEDIGNEIFNKLLWRSFFQEVKKDKDGNSVSCTIHDLLHDLACSITVNECFCVEETSQLTNVSRRTRHLLVSSETIPSSSVVESIHKSAPKLRTLIWSTQLGSEFPTHYPFFKFELVRALSLESVAIASLPVSVGNLKHLRYLKLSWATGITSLPESICGMRNLQTLKLENCFDFQTLPTKMRNMRSLRHLDIRGCDRVSQMPIGMGKLTCLHTLNFFIVGLDDGRHISELQAMDMLSGELEIKDLQHVRCSKDANLMRKRRLQSLRLTWSNSLSEDENARAVIEDLQPHSNIERLSIEGYQGLTFPSWLDVSFLHSLVKISLGKCRRCEFLPSLGRLPLLKTLRMSEMDSVKIFDSDDMVNGFPSLEELELDDMPELEEWSSLVGNSGVREEVDLFPSLEKLSIKKCPNLKRLPLSSSINSLDVNDCNEMVLQTFENRPRLSSLKISCFKELTSFPEGMLQNLTALQSLSISWCKKLKTLPMHLRELKRLEVYHCDEMVVMPEEVRNLPSLVSFTIHGCHDLSTLCRRCCQRWEGAL